MYKKKSCDWESCCDNIFVPFFSVQNVLPLIPKLKHVIYVDQKKVTTEGYPAGLSIHSMQAVRELGALPENSVYLLCLILIESLCKIQ